MIERFIAHLAETFEEVSALERRLALDDSDADTWEQLRAIAHKIAGTAAPYGFPALGVEAGRLEQVILADAEPTSDRRHSLRLFSEALSAAHR